MATRLCVRCGKAFQISPCKKKKYCNRACYNSSDEALAHRRANAPAAGKARGIQKTNPLGKKVLDSRGEYVYVKTPEGMRYEHRVLMELKVGRRLLRTEHVHHINHDKADNRIENLLLTTNITHRHEHRGEKRKPSESRRTFSMSRPRDSLGHFLPM